MSIRKVIACAALAAVAGGSALAVTQAEAQERVRWQVPMTFSSTLTALGDTMPWVSETL